MPYLATLTTGSFFKYQLKPLIIWLLSLQRAPCLKSCPELDTKMGRSNTVVNHLISFWLPVLHCLSRPQAGAVTVLGGWTRVPSFRQPETRCFLHRFLSTSSPRPRSQTSALLSEHSLSENIFPRSHIPLPLSRSLPLGVQAAAPLLRSTWVSHHFLDSAGQSKTHKPPFRPTPLHICGTLVSTGPNLLASCMAPFPASYSQTKSPHCFSVNRPSPIAFPNAATFISAYPSHLTSQLSQTHAFPLQICLLITSVASGFLQGSIEASFPAVQGPP